MYHCNTYPTEIVIPDATKRLQQLNISKKSTSDRKVKNKYQIFKKVSNDAKTDELPGPLGRVDGRQLRNFKRKSHFLLAI